jgi:hypothetical protein
MKTLLLRLFALASLFASTGMLRAADDLNAVFQRGRAAFYRGDYETAKVYLTQVATASPGHAETKNMLGYINAHGKKAAATPQQTYAAVILPKVEFADVTLPEALDGLRILTKNASQGRVTPNIIVKGTAVNEKKFSLTPAAASPTTSTPPSSAISRRRNPPTSLRRRPRNNSSHPQLRTHPRSVSSSR